MSGKKTNLRNCSISQLQDLTGAAYKTIKERLKDLKPAYVDGQADYYDSREALALIYKARSGQKANTDLSEERARLARAQREKYELQNAERRGILIPAEIVESVWADMLLNFKAKIMSISNKAAPIVSGLGSISEIEELLKKHHLEALNELAEFNSSDYGVGEHQEPENEDADEAEAAAEIDGEPVGGSV
jgi:phage terminase Nu1 subunit (DNA packaging protein)